MVSTNTQELATTFLNLSYFRIFDIFVTDILLRCFWVVLFFLSFKVVKNIKFTEKQSLHPVTWAPESCFLLVGIIIFIQHFFIFISSVVGKLVGGTVGYYISPYYNISGSLQNILFAFVILLFLRQLIYNKYNASFSILGFRKDKLKCGFLWGITLIILYGWFALTISKYIYETNYESYLKTLRYSLSLTVILSTLIVTPIFEEILFRGYIFQAFKKKLPFIWSAVFASLLFVMIHVSASYSKNSAILVFVMGIIIAGIFYISHSIIACIIFHAGVNFIALLRCYRNGYVFELFDWKQLLIVGFVASFVAIIILRLRLRVKEINKLTNEQDAKSYNYLQNR